MTAASVWALVRDWLATWEEYELRLDAPVVVGDVVVALVRHLGQARDSGVDVDQPGAVLYRVREDELVFVRPYTDRSEALVAAGLEDPERWLTAIGTVRAGYDAWNRRDFEALTQYIGEAEFVPVIQSPDMSAFRGREEARAFWESSVATWERFEFAPLAFEPHGDRLLVDLRVRGKARASGIDLEEEWAHVFTLGEREVVRLQAFTSRDEARAALLS